jgi:hypothetical protein
MGTVKKVGALNCHGGLTAPGRPDDDGGRVERESENVILIGGEIVECGQRQHQ